MRFPILILTSLFITSCSIFAPPTTPQTPQNPYMYYKGTESKVDLVARIQNFKHPKTSNQVSLIGMIHIADPSYYKQIQEKLDQSDIVLMEGVSGNGNFGIHHFFLNYLLAQQQRTADLAALLPQNYGLENKENWYFADMSMKEFADQGNFLFTLKQLISLPIAIAIIEPIYLSGRLAHTTSSIFGEKYRKAQELRIRNSVVNMMEAQDPTSNILPGIITARNHKLISELKKVTAKRKGLKVTIPWGAAHGPGLEKALLKEGYLKTTAKEITAIKLTHFVNSPTNPDEEPQKFGIPYLGSWYKYKQSSHCELAFALYNHTQTKDYHSWELLYKQLLLSAQNKESSYLSLFPKIFGRPMLLEYKRNKQKRSLNLLWFLKFNWEN